MSSTAGDLAKVALALTLVFGGCTLGTASSGVNPFFTDADGAVDVVQKTTNLTNVQADGYGWWGCANGEGGDLWRTDFKAENENGQTVTGTVCEGLFKGATIRYD